MAHLQRKQPQKLASKKSNIHQQNKLSKKKKQEFHSRSEKMADKRYKNNIGKIMFIFILFIIVFSCGSLFLMNQQTTKQMAKGVHQEVTGADAKQRKAQKAIKHFNKTIEKYCINANADDIKNQNINKKEYKTAHKELTRAYDALPKDYKPNFANTESKVLTMLKMQLAYNQVFSDKDKGKIKPNVSPNEVLKNNINFSSDLNTLTDQTGNNNAFVKRMTDDFTKLGNDAQRIISAYNSVNNDMKIVPNIKSDNIAQNVYDQIVNKQPDKMTNDDVKNMVDEDLKGDNKEMYAYVYGKLKKTKDFEIAHCYIVKNSTKYDELTNSIDLNNLNFKWNRQLKYLRAIIKSPAIKYQCEYYEQKAQKEAEEKAEKNSKKKAESSSQQEVADNYEQQRQKALENAYSQANKQQEEMSKQQSQIAEQQRQQQEQQQEQQSSSIQQSSQVQSSQSQSSSESDVQDVTGVDNDPNIQNDILTGNVPDE